MKQNGEGESRKRRVKKKIGGAQKKGRRVKNFEREAAKMENKAKKREGRVKKGQKEEE